MVHVGHHCLEIHLRFHGGHTVQSGGAHVVGHFGGLKQGLAGHAPAPGAVAADAVLFHHGDPLPCPDAIAQGRQPSRAAADDEQIVHSIHDEYLSSMFSR